MKFDEYWIMEVYRLRRRCSEWYDTSVVPDNVEDGGKHTDGNLLPLRTVFSCSDPISIDSNALPVEVLWLAS